MLVTFSIWQGSVFGSWLLKDRWIGLLSSTLKICTFQPWQFLPSCPKALLWFQGICRTWSFVSIKLHDLSGLHISQLETWPSSTSPLLLEELGFGRKLKSAGCIHWSYDGCFLLLCGVWQRCCTWFAGSVGAGMQRCMLHMDCNSTLYSLFLILSLHVQADSCFWLGAQQVRQAAGTGWWCWVPVPAGQEEATHAPSRWSCVHTINKLPHKVLQQFFIYAMEGFFLWEGIFLYLFFSSVS